MRAGWAYFVSLQQAARDFSQLARTKLPMPVLAIGGEKANTLGRIGNHKNFSSASVVSRGRSSITPMAGIFQNDHASHSIS
jgi:hypothetical protein